MSQRQTHRLVHLVVSLVVLALVTGLGIVLTRFVASLGSPEWIVWVFAIAYTVLVMVGYFALKRTRLGKYLWTLPDGITW